MGAKSSLDLDSDPRAIIGMREFDAPRDLVFDAHPVVSPQRSRPRR